MKATCDPPTFDSDERLLPRKGRTMTLVFNSETFRDDFSFSNSPAAVRRFPFPFDRDAYMYAVNIEPHTAGPVAPHGLPAS